MKKLTTKQADVFRLAAKLCRPKKKKRNQRGGCCGILLASRRLTPDAANANAEAQKLIIKFSGKFNPYNLNAYWWGYPSDASDEMQIARQLALLLMAEMIRTGDI